MIYPIALEAFQWLDALFGIERTINGKTSAEQLATRQDLSAPLMNGLHTWLTSQVGKLSRTHDPVKACLYMLKRCDAFTRFLNDGRICLTNNAAERALRCIPLGGARPARPKRSSVPAMWSGRHRHAIGPA